MRRLCVTALLLLFACKAEPDLDERYEAADNKVHENAAEIDAQIENRSTEESKAEEGIAEPNPPD